MFGLCRAGGWRGGAAFLFLEGGLGGVTGSEFRVLRIHDFGVEGLSGFQEHGSEPRCFVGELTRVNSGWLWELKGKKRLWGVNSS